MANKKSFFDALEFGLIALIAICVAAVLVTIASAVYHRKARSPSDQYVRNNLVLLHSEIGTCTGIEVVAPSKKVYTLTAAHCYVLLDGPTEDTQHILGRDERGIEHPLFFIDINVYSDLMLLTNDTQDGIAMAPNVELYDLVHTITHGQGAPSYRTDGEVLSLGGVYQTGFDMIKIGLLTTAKAKPGSSGGPLLDKNNQLVGVVVAGNDAFTWCTPLNQIRAFLEGR